jgi:lipoprotein-anchoring transpeptidase ErfK/SrfK
VQAIVAFQKVEGLSPDGVAGPLTQAALAAAARPAPRLSAPGTRVEIDLTRQVLFLITDDVVIKTLAVSTGKPGWRTPPGSFKVFRRIPAWHRSPLGLLYKPCYVVGGIAIHGSNSVPAYPASHGCIRVTLKEMDALYGQLPMGLRADVYH